MPTPINFETLKLTIEIKNTKPVELIDLTKSLVSLGNQYNKHAASEALFRDLDAKLMVKKIETSSIILDLIEQAKPSLVPLLENTNTVIAFGVYLKEVIEYFKTGTGNKKELKKSDYEDFNSILNPIAKDNGSQINISAKDDANVYLTINVNSLEANALQNQFRNEIEIKNAKEDTDTHERVLFYWDTAKSDIHAEKGNKGIIESISKKALNVTFESDDIKAAILHSHENNPLIMAYEIDVVVQTIQDKPAVYRITKVHQSFLRDEEA